MLTYLEFEKPIAALDQRISELRDGQCRRYRYRTGSSTAPGQVGAVSEGHLCQADAVAEDTQVARHPERPHFKHYVAGITDDFIPLAGDRAFADDPAIIGGLARIDNRKVMLIGHEKGDDTASRLKHNFGMAKPEGYRSDPAVAAGRSVRCRSSAWSIRPAPFQAFRQRNGGRPRRLPVRPNNACPGCADGCSRGRRGRVRRCGGHRRGQSGADVRACGLFRHFARRMRFDPVAHGRQGGGRGRGNARHRQSPAVTRRRRPGGSRAARRSASRSRRGRRQFEEGNPRGARRAGEARPGAIAGATAQEVPVVG